MFCANCGGTPPPNATYCPLCGARQPDAAAFSDNPFESAARLDDCPGAFAGRRGLPIVRSPWAHFQRCWRGALWSGRARRAEFWSFFLIFTGLYLLGIAAAIALCFAASQLGFDFDESGAACCVALFLGAFFVPPLIAVVPSFALACRRLRDANVSGLFVLLVLLPYVGEFAWLVFGLLPGTDGPNRFGPDPRYEEEPNDEFARFSELPEIGAVDPSAERSDDVPS